MNSLYRGIQCAYNATLRPVLPRVPVEENGVAVRRVKPLDWHDGSDNYEAGLINGLRRATEPGDWVCIVGGGWGVSTCHAVDCGARPVDVYEPGNNQMKYCVETIENNVASSGVRVHHAAVGKAENVYGETTADVIRPDELPDSDVLVMDCEGAELGILADMPQRPREIVVEVHPGYGVPEGHVRKTLNLMDYEIEYREEEQHDDPIIILGAEHQP